MATSDKVQKLSGEAFCKLRSDHEQFLEAYEKPTQIYRFLKARHSLRPLFLHRNLSYMRMHRNTSGTKRKRVKKFRVDDLIKHTKQTKPDLATCIKSDNHLKLSLVGLEEGVDFEELLEKSSSSCSKLTNQCETHKSHDSQLVEVEILLYRFNQPSAEALLSGRKDSFHCTCSSLGKRVVEYSDKVGKHGKSKISCLPLLIPESSLMWRGREKPGGTQMLIFRASQYKTDRTGTGDGLSASSSSKQKCIRKVTPRDLKETNIAQSSRDKEQTQIIKDNALLERHSQVSPLQIASDKASSSDYKFSSNNDFALAYKPKSTFRLSNTEENQIPTKNSNESSEQPNYSLRSKVKPQMKDACVMTDTSFGTDDISELVPVYQSQIVSLSSLEGDGKGVGIGSSLTAMCNGSHSPVSKPRESTHEHQLSKPLAPTQSRQDRCTSPLIPKRMLLNGTLNRFVNGYAAPEITALRENGARVQPKWKLFQFAKSKKTSKMGTVDGQKSIPAVFQSSPVTQSVPRDDNECNVTAFQPSSLKRLGSGKQGSRSFLISFPRYHYDNLHNGKIAHSNCVGGPGFSKEDSSHLKNSDMGKNGNKNSVYRRRTEIQLLLDGDKPRGQRLSADEIPTIIAEDVSSWSLTTPEKSSWLGSSTRRITPVDHFSFPISSLSPRSNGNFLSLYQGGSATNHRKRAYSEESDNSTCSTPPYSNPKVARMTSPSGICGSTGTHVPVSPSILSPSVQETNKQKLNMPKEIELQPSASDALNQSALKDHNYALVSNGNDTFLQKDEVFCAELVVCDSRGDCLLKDGEYAVLMQKCMTDKDVNSNDLLTFEPLSWSSIFGEQNHTISTKKSRNLLLKFSLSWTNGPPLHQLYSEIDTALDFKKIRETYYLSSPSPPPTNESSHQPVTIAPPSKTSLPNQISPATELSVPLAPLNPTPTIENVKSSTSQVTDQLNHHTSNLPESENMERTNTTDIEYGLSIAHHCSSYAEPSLPSVEKEKIFFNFLYGNNSLQQTECRVEMQCPWCFVQCSELYALLKHMSLCHPRFHFTYSPSNDSNMMIDVHVNKMYDTSSSIERDPGERTSITQYLKKKNRPSKCLPCTCVLVEKGSSTDVNNGLAEFLNDGSWRRGYTSNRMYYHSSSCLPMLEEEIQVDSEEEESTLGWQKYCSQKMLDEFTDVNKGEKRLMKLWNVFVIENKLIAEKQLPTTSILFTQKKKQTLLEEKIDRNFLSHLISLYDFGLIPSITVRQCMTILYASD